MSFLDKIRGKGKGRDDAGGTALPPDEVIALAVPVHDETVPAAADPRSHASTAPAHIDSSIITEAAPSEIAEFSETRMPTSETVPVSGTGLPLIGDQAVGTHQRLLVGILVGLVFYVVNEVTASIGQLYGWHPLLAAGLPTAGLAALALLRLQRAR